MNGFNWIGFSSSFFLGGLLLGVFLSILGQFLVTSLYRLLDKRKIHTRDDWIFLVCFFIFCVFIVIFFFMCKTMFYWR